MDNGDDVIATFMAITGSSEDDAVMYLSMNDFDLQQAVVSFQADHNGHADNNNDDNGNEHHTTAASAAASQDAPSPSVDSGSPSSPQQPMSYPMQGFGSPSEEQRPATPPNARTLGSGSNANLQQLFARPAYVSGSDNASLVTECNKAAERSCWMVVAVVDNSFGCECFTRDVWGSEAMRSLTSGSIFCHEVNVTHSRGATVAEKYGVNTQQLPYMFIVDPVTKFKVGEVPLVSSEVWRFDSALVVDALMLFITSHDPPHDPFANPEASEEREPSADRQARPAAGTAPLVVDVDSEVEMQSPPTVTPSAMAQAELAGGSFAVVAPSPVSLDDYLVPGDAPDGTPLFKLRCRLPHSSPTLQMRPYTPVTRLVEYLAYLVYTEDKAKFTVQPNISIFSGFPPRNVTAGDMEGVTLSTWTGVRSGDVVMVRLDA